MKIIYDTNTVIYAFSGGRLSSFFEFKKHNIFISSEIFNWEMEKYTDVIESAINQKKLTLLDTTPEADELLDSLTSKYRKGQIRTKAGICENDLRILAIALAELLDAIATADHQLRAAAQAEGCQPLWMLDLVGFLLDEKIFTKDEAREFYAKAYKGSERKFQSAIDEQLARY